MLFYTLARAAIRFLQPRSSSMTRTIHSINLIVEIIPPKVPFRK